MACFASVAALGATLTLAAAGDPALKIGTGPSFPPYLIEAEGTPPFTGLDFEMMEEICARMTRACHWTQVEFDQLIPGVMDGQFDVVLGGMAITPERREKVDFSQAYTWGEGVDWFVGPAGTPPPEDSRSGAVSGTIQEKYLHDQGYDFRSYPNEATLLNALSRGEIDLALGPFEARPDLETLIEGQGFSYLFSAEVPDEGVGIAVCRGNHQLLAQIDAALHAMFEDGTMEQLDTRWQ